MFHIYFSYSETFLSYIPVVYTRIRCFHTQEVPYIHITTEIRRLPVACPIRLPQLCEVSSSSGVCAPSSVTIYLPTLFLLHLLDLAYCLAPWYSNDSPFSHH